jgi:hypothetical protein
MQKETTRNEYLDDHDDEEKLRRDVPVESDESTGPQSETLSPDLDAGDVDRAEEYESDGSQYGYQIKEIDGVLDLVLNEKAVGTYVAEQDRDNYFSAIEDARAYGRGVWIAESEEAIYATVILCSAEDAYECHTYKLNLVIEKEAEEKVEEELFTEVEELVPEHTSPSELLNEYSPNFEVENNTPIAEKPIERFFTTRELYDHAIEVSSSENISEQEISPIENSDVAISVENDSIAHDTSIEHAEIVLESLAVELPLEIPSLELQESIVEPSLEYANVKEISTPVAETVQESTAILIEERVAVPQIIESISDNKVDATLENETFFAESQKNEALISPITSAIETARLNTPEKSELLDNELGELQEEIIALELKQDTNVARESTIVSPEKQVQKSVETIESFDDLVAVSFETRVIAPEVQRSASEDTLTDTNVESGGVHHVEQVVPEFVAEQQIIPATPDVGPRETLERSSGIQLVEKRITSEPLVYVESPAAEIISSAFNDHAPESYTNKTEIELSGISIVTRTIEQMAPSSSTIPVQNQTTLSVDENIETSSDVPEPIAIAA